MWRNMLNPGSSSARSARYSIELAAHKETKNDTQYRKYLSEMHKVRALLAESSSRWSPPAVHAARSWHERHREDSTVRLRSQRELQGSRPRRLRPGWSKLFRVSATERPWTSARTRIGKFLHAVHNGAIGWSNMFYNVPLAAQYIAMRECGLSARSPPAIPPRRWTSPTVATITRWAASSFRS